VSASPTPPTLTVTSITITAPDPRQLAAFYARLLGVEVTTIEEPREDEPATAGWAQIRTERLTLNFEFEQFWRQPRWPAAAGEQFASQHLDIHVENLDDAVAWAQQCGATLAGVQRLAQVRVMLDPAGHPFCLFT
jgi:catechol 2,3-dioxygenase-like lactoylglutathione lyase family enzyme